MTFTLLSRSFTIKHDGERIRKAVPRISSHLMSSNRVCSSSMRIRLSNRHRAYEMLIHPDGDAEPRPLMPVPTIAIVMIDASEAPRCVHARIRSNPSQ